MPFRWAQSLHKIMPLHTHRPGHTMTTAIPVLSLKPIVEGAANADATVARDLQPILESWGAFQLVDHGVPPAVMSGAFKSAERFFQLPLEQRMTIRVDKHNRGYVPMHQTHYPGNKPDLKE